MHTDPRTNNQNYSRWRRLQLDFRVFIHLFPWRSAGFLLLALLTAALFFQQAYRRTYLADEPDFSYVKALYAIVNMATFQVSFSDIPPGPALDSFFILVPLISTPLLLMLGANLIHILRVFFVRHERGQIWQQALAQTIKDPVVVCGVGRIGYRIASYLHAQHYPVIGIEAVHSSLVDELIEKDIPVILGDIRNSDVLRNAAVLRSHQVIVCTHDDLANIMAVNYVRELNPKAEIILRLFDDDIADEIKSTYNIKTILSRSAVAAQTFAYTAMGMDVLETFQTANQTFVLAELPLPAHYHFDETIQTYTKGLPCTTVCLVRKHTFSVEPAADTVLCANDNLIVFIDLQHLAQLDHIFTDKPGHFIVCGLGHTGFRIAKALQNLEQRVTAMEFKPDELTEQLEAQGVKVVYGDYRKKTALIEAQISEARACIICSENDMINFETVIHAREISSQQRIICRIFEEELGMRLQHTFNIEAVYSTSALAAPAFIAAAVNVHLSQPVNLGQADYVIARLQLHQNSPILSQSIAQVNHLATTTVLLHRRGHTISVPPPVNERLQVADEIVVLTSH
ncbi:MAG: NAD-binding protein, partial [Anaerolineae bacterium]|nr:NAD-binding protein [Anaerolineae bacterium]